MCNLWTRPLPIEIRLLQIEWVIKLSLQRDQARKELRLSRRLGWIDSQIGNFLWVSSHVIKPGDAGLGVHYQLPTVVRDGSLKFKIRTVDCRIVRLRLLAAEERQEAVELDLRWLVDSRQFERRRH